MHDRRSIRARRSDGGTIKGMAREFGASRNAIRRAIDPDAALDYRRATLADQYEPAIRDVLADYPRMQVPQIAQVIDWPGSRSTLSTLVARLRPQALEREREDLNVPALGHLVVGKVTVGQVGAGKVTVGVVRYGRTADSIRDPLHAP